MQSKSDISPHEIPSDTLNAVIVKLTSTYSSCSSLKMGFHNDEPKLMTTVILINGWRHVGNNMKEL